MKTILVDFDVERGRPFDQARPIGVLLERGNAPGFESQYLASVTEEGDSGHDNFLRTMEATALFREAWDGGRGDAISTTVERLFTYLADQSYLGLRLRSIGHVEDGVTLSEAFERYVTRAEPLVEQSDKEFPGDV